MLPAGDDPGAGMSATGGRANAARRCSATSLSLALSRVATIWKSAVKGTFRFRLNYLGDNQYAAGASAPVTVKVK
jgi:hypothetical protein